MTIIISFFCFFILWHALVKIVLAWKSHGKVETNFYGLAKERIWMKMSFVSNFDETRKKCVKFVVFDIRKIDARKGGTYTCVVSDK